MCFIAAASAVRTGGQTIQYKHWHRAQGPIFSFLWLSEHRLQPKCKLHFVALADKSEIWGVGWSLICSDSSTSAAHSLDADRNTVSPVSDRWDVFNPPFSILFIVFVSQQVKQETPREANMGLCFVYLLMASHSLLFMFGVFGGVNHDILCPLSDMNPEDELMV